jgi:(1->4)-alpha-D-glucan 1-alpha-D-glucosylmutase
LAFLGAHNTAVQTVLKLTLPGVPDIYQGTELWDFSLVDPDNRRPVDFPIRASTLRELKCTNGSVAQALPSALFDNWRDGRFKMATTLTLLHLRREYPTLFAHGDYRPLWAEGELSDEYFGFVRNFVPTSMVVVISRFPGRSDRARSLRWKLPPELPASSWRNVLNGLHCSALDSEILSRGLSDFPAAVFITSRI